MNCSVRAIQILIVTVVAGVPAGATAGEIGPTSRATVSISITIPPHVVVQSTSEPDPRRGAAVADGLCVATNGLSNYHLALLGPAGLPQEMTGLSGRFSTDEAGRSCLPAERASTNRADSAGPLVAWPASSSGPVTLLIVPD